jgi:hypothetical protein
VTDHGWTFASTGHRKEKPIKGNRVTCRGFSFTFGTSQPLEAGSGGGGGAWSMTSAPFGDSRG